MHDLKHILSLDIDWGEIPVLGQKLGLFQNFTWGRKDLALNQESQLLPLKDKGLPQFNSLPLPSEVFCLPAWVFLSKGGKPTTRRPLPQTLLLPFLLFWGLGFWPWPVPLPLDLPWLFTLSTHGPHPLLVQPFMSGSPWPKHHLWSCIGELLPGGPLNSTPIPSKSHGSQFPTRNIGTGYLRDKQGNLHPWISYPEVT